MSLVSVISAWSVPIIIIIIIASGIVKGIKIYEVFTEGAADGIKTVLRIFPYLLAMVLAINVFRASGALEMLVDLFQPISTRLNIPEAVMPLMFLRPLSGSGSLAYTDNLMKAYGADSFIGKLASTIQGSTETTFYIIAVYFGAVGIRKYRYAITVGLLADLAGFFAAVFICKVLFL
ncbi:MAG: spore maturation protein [Halanaerobiales bacterium]